MPPSGPNPYLRTKIMTANPQELRLMLYEGAVRFCRQSLAAMEKNDHDASFDALMRAQKIVLELSTSLKHEVAPDLCTKLTALYNYIYKQLVEATLQRDPNLVKEALTLLEYETQTWRMLMDKLTQEPGDGSTDHAQVTAPQQTAISSLSQNA